LDRDIEAEQVILQRVYDRAGRNALAAAIARRIADERLDGRLYLFAGPSYAPVAGNLTTWPSAVKDAKGWITFGMHERAPDAANRPLRAAFQTLHDGSHLLVGRDIEDLDEFAVKIKTALALCILLIFVLAGVASLYVTRRTVGRIEAINATSR